MTLSNYNIFIYLFYLAISRMTYISSIYSVFYFWSK